MKAQINHDQNRKEMLEKFGQMFKVYITFLSGYKDSIIVHALSEEAAISKVKNLKSLQGQDIEKLVAHPLKNS